MKKINRKIVGALSVVTMMALFAIQLQANPASDERNETVEDMDSKIEVQPTQDIYSIGSISKVYTAAAIMKLVEEGQIDLDCPVTDYIPEFTMQDERYQDITVRMLLNHKSGMMGMTEHDAVTIGACDSRFHDNILEELSLQGLKADPGAYSVYCNDGFSLAELIVERVSKMSFAEYLEQNFWEPLDIEDSCSTGYRFDEDRVADCYVGFTKLPYIDCHMIGSGGLYSTATDVAKFGQIFTENGKGILSEESLDMMAHSYSSEDEIGLVEGDKQFDYGLGWDCVNTYPYSEYGIQALYKGGSIVFQNAALVVLPEQNISAAMIVSGGNGMEASYALQDLILEVLEEEGLIEKQDLSVSTQLEPKLEPLPEEMREYAGYYLSTDMLKISFSEDGKLLLEKAEDEYDMVLECGYIGNGCFTPLNGAYLNNLGELTYSSNGSMGTGILYFETDTNGKTYLMASTYETIYELGENAATMAMAEKVEPMSEESVPQEYQERDGKKYFLIQSVYNSWNYYTDAIKEFRLYNAPAGYISTDCRNDFARITDANHAVNEVDLPIMVGRDLKTYDFISDGENERMTISSMTYLSEEGVEPIDTLSNQLEMSQYEDAKWYRISEGYEGKTIQIDVPSQGAFYLYDSEGECIASSVTQEEYTKILLPKEGYLLFAGESGNVFEITIES